jgi:hypothetical protein
MWQRKAKPSACIPWTNGMATHNRRCHRCWRWRGFQKPPTPREKSSAALGCSNFVKCERNHRLSFSGRISLESFLCANIILCNDAHAHQKLDSAFVRLSTACYLSPVLVRLSGQSRWKLGIASHSRAMRASGCPEYIGAEIRSSFRSRRHWTLVALTVRSDSEVSRYIDIYHSGRRFFPRGQRSDTSSSLSSINTAEHHDIHRVE